MSFTLMLSEELVLAAHLCGEVEGRTAEEQIEFWAGLGKAVESVMRPEDVLALRISASVESLDECIRQMDTPASRQRLNEYLVRQPFSHFESVSGNPQDFIRIEADGTRTKVRFTDGNPVQV